MKLFGKIAPKVLGAALLLTPLAMTASAPASAR